MHGNSFMHVRRPSREGKKGGEKSATAGLRRVTGSQGREEMTKKVHRENKVAGKPNHPSTHPSRAEEKNLKGSSLLDPPLSLRPRALPRFASAKLMLNQFIIRCDALTEAVTSLFICIIMHSCFSVFFVAMMHSHHQEGFPSPQSPFSSACFPARYPLSLTCTPEPREADLTSFSPDRNKSHK
mmetsp:Transcript_3378/g.6985  ORF Transcript_3378/g.6985 Transcript_3378/m.6985 type:complete len:183 (-) Transcript_3378:552-1100(-)